MATLAIIMISVITIVSQPVVNIMIIVVAGVIIIMVTFEPRVVVQKAEIASPCLISPAIFSYGRTKGFGEHVAYPGIFYLAMFGCGSYYNVYRLWHCGYRDEANMPAIILEIKYDRYGRWYTLRLYSYSYS